MAVVITMSAYGFGEGHRQIGSSATSSSVAKAAIILHDGAYRYSHYCFWKRRVFEHLTICNLVGNFSVLKPQPQRTMLRLLVAASGGMRLKSTRITVRPHE